MHLLAGKDRVTAWLKKNGWPSPTASNCFEWAISPDKGKVPEDSWTTWDGDWDSIVRDRKVIFRRKGYKSYTHIHLDSEPGISEQKGKEPDPQPFMIPPEIVRERSELAELRRQLVEREASLRAWENDIRVMEVEIKKSQAMTVRIGSELDQRVAANMARMKEYEDHLDRKKKTDEEYIRELTDALGELTELKEKQLIVGQVVYTIDKIAMAMSIRGIKNISDDELKKLPPGFIDEFAKFLADKAERHLFSSVPDPFMLVGEAFMRLPTNNDKYELCRIIMGWLIENDLNKFNSLGKEVVESFKERQKAS